MRVIVFGLGKMGLPLAVQCASAGHQVIGVDIDAKLVARIQAGDNPCMHEPGLDERLSASLRMGRLTATTDAAAAVRQAEAIVVIVPVKLSSDMRADLGAILTVTTQIGQNLRPGTLVSYETTLPVGTTRQELVPRLQALSQLRCGVDFHVVFSPERVKSNLVFEKLNQTPKVVGGYSPACTEHGRRFYASCLDSEVLNAETLEAAELIKLAGMLYRDVNIALVNQLAIYAMVKGVDLHQVIPWANTDGESALLQPGIGVGGHCTPIYPYFLIHDAEAQAVDLSLAKQARQVNDTMLARLLETAKIDVAGKRVLILGLAFRPEIKEDTASPTYTIEAHLRRLGAQPYVHDPFYTPDELIARNLQPARLSPDETYHIAILSTLHQAYQKLDPHRLRRMGIGLFLDGRNGFDPAVIEEADMQYVGVGRWGSIWQ
jgi:nucleotide sugar dehydrogenase